MKQIFDWLREQMEEEPKRLRKMKNQCIALSDSEVLAIEEKAYGFYRQCVDEAEAKWEAECCEWNFRFGNKEFIMCPEANNIILQTMNLKHYPYCPVCGKPIKISEVE